MASFDDDADWKARNSKHIEPEQNYFSEPALNRWTQANSASSTLVEADQLQRALAQVGPLYYLWHLQARYPVRWLVVLIAFVTFYGGITSLTTDICLAIAQKSISGGFYLYQYYTVPLFGTQTSRWLHTSNHASMPWNTQLINYFLIKTALTIFDALISLLWALASPPHQLSTLQSLVVMLIALFIPAMCMMPQTLVAWLDWTLGMGTIGLGKGFVGGVTAYLWLGSWMWEAYATASLWMQHHFWPTDEFVYTSLASDEIRLLHLHRKLPFCGVRASIAIVRLDKLPTYEAISYTWGNSQDRCTILLQGKRFSTTRSAWEALTTHGSFWRPMTVWIDQICINQNDDIEKGQQVAMMFDIYSNADRVVAHLGTSPFAKVAVGMLSELMWQEFQDSDTELAGFMAVATLFHNYEAICELLQHPWFSRIWVVQEVAAAKELAVAYGGFMIDWESMASALRVLLRPGIRDGLVLRPALFDKISRALINVMEMMEIGHQVRMNRAGGLKIEVLKLTAAYSLPYMLGKTSGFMASDMRDKIYALQSVSLPARRPHGESVLLEYDYTQSIESLYLELALRVVFHSPEPYYMMNFAGLSKQGQLELPSWVPDWTSPAGRLDSFNQRVVTHYLDLVDVVGQVLDRATGTEMRPTPKHESYRAAGSTRHVCRLKSYNLSVHGVRVGSVTKVGQVKPPDVQQDSEPYVDRHNRTMFPARLKKIAAWYREAMTLALEVYHDPIACVDAFWRSLIGDRWQMVRPAPTRAFDAYLSSMYVLKCWEETCDRLDRGETDVELPNHELFLEARMFEGEWLTAFGACAANRSFCTIADKYIGIVPLNTESGDIIVIALGATVPWVLRPLVKAGQAEEGKYLFVGECYVHGLMDGELITRNIFIGSNVLWEHFEEPRRSKVKTADAAEKHPEPAWVTILEKYDMIEGRNDDGPVADDDTPLEVEDVFQQDQSGDCFVPGCEWFTLC
ncbi:hypothetical protein AMS68_002769 [Peltaster fructicola]|uniref:Heterokaryon incompatibility domain-containing protein n=1 Tax=Peltaster fructicola TaxID=286661 RepID=A0A6H0XR55_9PEZI|nr:hypothetical protein AMS68_002769 [Peltaster fructicola]